MGITNVGLAVVTGLTGNVDTQTAFTYLALGTGTTAFAVTQEALVTEIVAGVDTGLVRASATVARATTNTTNDTIQFTKTFTAAPVSSAAVVSEVGVFNASSSGVMLARTVLGTTRTLETSFTYTLVYKVVFDQA